MLSLDLELWPLNYKFKFVTNFLYAKWRDVMYTQQCLPSIPSHKIFLGRAINIIISINFTHWTHAPFIPTTLLVYLVNLSEKINKQNVAITLDDTTKATTEQKLLFNKMSIGKWAYFAKKSSQLQQGTSNEQYLDIGSSWASAGDEVLLNYSTLMAAKYGCIYPPRIGVVHPILTTTSM